jgi:cobalt-zinc-cadmium efflux system protein
MDGSQTPETTVAFDLQKAAQLRFAVGLTAVVFAGELVGGLLTGSLALLSDAWHVFSDILALGLSLSAVGLACRPPTSRHTYGLHRVEVLVALANGGVLVLISLGILWEAYRRLAAPGHINSLPMLVVAVVGLAANGLVALRLGGHSHGDLNLRSAYLHVLGDLLASVGVVIAALVIWLTGWVLVDPIISAGIAVLIIFSAYGILRDSVHILLEGVPAGVDLEHVVADLQAVPGVSAVHSVQAWSICSNVLAFSAHVVTCPETEAERRALRCELDRVLVGHGFALTTLELECEPDCSPELLKQLTHGADAGHDHESHDHHHHEPGDSH